MSLGLYLAVPFCRSKCSFCNFASGVFSRQRMNSYVATLCREIANAEAFAKSIGAEFSRSVDSIYVGGGTPTTLAPEQLEQIFATTYKEFDVQKDAEITVECAPGTLHPEILDVLLYANVSRVSLGTQSFVDQEIRWVGRLHSAAQARADVVELQQNGIHNINLDLIAGLPHQTEESWRRSLEEVIELKVPHASVYMLEVDEDSRLGRELIAGGERYHAHHVPDSDLVADLYLEAVDFLEKAGLAQYEISNFAVPTRESQHNLKYWIQQPYLGFGLDAHSMLLATQPDSDCETFRLADTDDLEAYLSGPPTPAVRRIGRRERLEESIFLQLRLNRGLNVEVQGPDFDEIFNQDICELTALGLLERSGAFVRLTTRGRLLSNEVFEKFIDVHQIV